MTLGRTSSGAIKIKTDGGLRAVECACCVTAVCGCTRVSSELKVIIESATTLTVNGSDQSWDGTRSVLQLGFGELSWEISYSQGIICVAADTGDNTVTLGAECLFTTGPDIQINGESFISSHAFNEFQISLQITFS